jgi:four helix bundle protein
MAGVRNFTDLLFWQKSRAWSKAIFHHALDAPFKRDSRLVSQINDSSESVMANIAEGFGRGTQGEFVTFLGYAIGSLNETQAHRTAAYDREYIAKDNFGDLFQQGTEIRKMIIAFIKSMVMPGSGVKNVRKTIDFKELDWLRYERITGKERPERFRGSADDEDD